MTTTTLTRRTALRSGRFFAPAIPDGGADPEYLLDLLEQSARIVPTDSRRALNLATAQDLLKRLAQGEGDVRWYHDHVQDARWMLMYAEYGDDAYLNGAMALDY